MITNTLRRGLKSGDIVQYGIRRIVFNEKNLPNFRIVKYYGKLNGTHLINGKTHIQPVIKEDHPKNQHYVHATNIYKKAKDSTDIMEVLCPEGFTLEKKGIAVNAEGKIYAGQGLLLDMPDKKLSTKKTAITLVDLSKSTRRTKKSELDEAIKKQKDFVKGKTNG